MVRARLLAFNSTEGRAMQLIRRKCHLCWINEEIWNAFSLAILAAHISWNIAVEQTFQWKAVVLNGFVLNEWEELHLIMQNEKCEFHKLLPILNSSYCVIFKEILTYWPTNNTAFWRFKNPFWSEDRFKYRAAGKKLLACKYRCFSFPKIDTYSIRFCFI